MPNYSPSLQERKQALLDALREDCMCGGANGFEGSAAPEGPVAGFDPLLGKALKKVRKKKDKKEGA
jgi:hypothetical protein